MGLESPADETQFLISPKRTNQAQRQVNTSKNERILNDVRTLKNQSLHIENTLRVVKGKEGEE